MMLVRLTIKEIILETFEDPGNAFQNASHNNYYIIMVSSGYSESPGGQTSRKVVFFLYGQVFFIQEHSSAVSGLLAMYIVSAVKFYIDP